MSNVICCYAANVRANTWALYRSIWSPQIVNMQMCNLIHKGLIKSHTGLTPDCSYGWWMDQRVELKSQPIHIDCCAKLATQINCCTRWRALHDLIAIRLSLLFGYSWPKKRETACYTTWSTTQHLNLHSSLEDSYPMKRPYCPTHWFPLYMVFNRMHITEIVIRRIPPIRYQISKQVRKLKLSLLW